MTLTNSPQNNYKEVIQQVLERAKDKGYRFSNALDYNDFSVTSFNPETGNVAIVLRSDNCRKILYDRIQLIFYDVEFAKAFFGSNWPQHIVELSKSTDKYSYLASKLND